jgi:hypothetical protein
MAITATARVSAQPTSSTRPVPHNAGNSAAAFSPAVEPVEPAEPDPNAGAESYAVRGDSRAAEAEADGVEGTVPAAGVGGWEEAEAEEEEEDGIESMGGRADGVRDAGASDRYKGSAMAGRKHTAGI